MSSSDGTDPGSPALTKAPDTGIHPSTPAPMTWPAPASAPAASAPAATPASANAPAMPIVGTVDEPDAPSGAAAKRKARVQVRMTKATRKRLKAQAQRRGLTLKEHLARIVEQAAGHGTGSDAS